MNAVQAAGRRRNVAPGIPFDWVALEDEFPELTSRQFAALRRHLLAGPLKGLYAWIRQQSKAPHLSPSAPEERIRATTRDLRDALKAAAVAEAQEERLSLRSLAAEVPGLRREGIENAWMFHFVVGPSLRRLLRVCDNVMGRIDWARREVPRPRLRGARRGDFLVCLHTLEALHRAGLPVEASRGGAASRLLRWALQVADRCWEHPVAPRKDVFRLTRKMVAAFKQSTLTRTKG